MPTRVLGVGLKGWAWIVVLWGVGFHALAWFGGTLRGAVMIAVLVLSFALEGSEPGLHRMDAAEARVKAWLDVAPAIGWGLIAVGAIVLLFLAVRGRKRVAAPEQDEDDEADDEDEDVEEDGPRVT